MRRAVVYPGGDRRMTINGRKKRLTARRDTLSGLLSPSAGTRQADELAPEPSYAWLMNRSIPERCCHSLELRRWRKGDE